MPSALRDARACKRTQPFPKYISDGSGRDLTMTFQRDPLPPKFNHFFNDNRPEKLAKEMKTFQAKIHTTARFVPNGSGRDLFQQVNEDYVFPISTSFSPIEKTSQKSHFAQNRPKSVPRYVPTGSGRDLYLTDLDASRCASPLSFKISKPNASNLNVLRARTSPPPRFVATGSGRDSFQNPNLYRPSKSPSPKNEGFQYGSSSISRNARYKHSKPSRSFVSQNETMKRLSTNALSRGERVQSAPLHKKV